MTTVDDPTPTSSSGALSLVDLRRQLLRRASELAVRAKACRARGEVHAAARMNAEAGRLLHVARDMGRRERP